MEKLRKFIKEKNTKKGFTLVELLAVMVVLALIMVLVAPNVLESMNRSKESAMKIYAKKMINTAKEQYQADKLNGAGGLVGNKVYRISTKLAPDQSQYIGCVVVTAGTATTKDTYKVTIVDKVNAKQLINLEYSAIDGATWANLTNANYTTETNIAYNGSTNKCVDS